MSEPWELTGAGYAGVVDLDALASALLTQAQAASSGRAAHAVVSGSLQRAVVIALDAGSQLHEHESPAAATLHCLRGRVRLHTGQREGEGAGSWEVAAGQLVVIPDQRHAVDALEDSVFLLTVRL